MESGSGAQAAKGHEPASQPASCQNDNTQKPATVGTGVTEQPQPQSQPQTVRFASANQEIEPAPPLQSTTTQESGQTRPEAQLTPEAQAELRSISLGLHSSRLQHRRMSNFAFEPVSLPVSRAPSNEASPYSSRQPTRSGHASPMLTPHEASLSQVSLSGEGSQVESEGRQTSDMTEPETGAVLPDAVEMAPPASIHQKTPAGVGPGETTTDAGLSPSTPTTRPSSASDHTSTRPTTLSQGSSMADAFSKQPPGSRDVSPKAQPRPSSGTTTPSISYARPFTPRGNEDDPYARNKRRPQSKNLDTIDPRFVFEGKDARRRSGVISGSTSSATGPIPRSGSGSDIRNQEKRQSTFSLHTIGGKKDAHGHRQDEAAAAVGGKHHHGSMTDLKRFLGIGHHKAKRSQSPAASSKKSIYDTGYKTPPHRGSSVNVPFADDHGLTTKWGKFGKVLGAGAGGSVRLLKRSGDGVTFAVKQFRDRHAYETEREYTKKVTAEFCIGSTLHHGNIIETMDIVHERGHWYEVMEYAPYDLFAVVMTGKMSREEICCSFLQIVSGVAFLHNMGLAHRDLKLDNVVVNEHGIMKLIDFGSATVFRYPFETDIVLASGVVGSDPYLAPEVYDSQKYDPQPTDVWSLAIIFACMTLRRFPWKAPRLTDNSYKLFVSSPSPGASSDTRPKTIVEATPAAQAPAQEGNEDAASERSAGRHHHHHHRQPQSQGREEGPPISDDQRQSQASRTDVAKAEVVKGPWRLLRLLPRESRHIIGRMLEVNPPRRATLEDIMGDTWVASTPVCSQIEGGQVVRAPGHQHTLEPGNSTQLPET
ncbi:MAG: hypothetical protein Q9220_007381 [cf. Caloplaca sp. 1 TL-2023]